MDATYHIGLVKWWNDSKGFGFITSMQGHDLFANWTEIEMEGFKTLQEGQEISYTVQVSEKGLRAYNIKPL